MRGRVRVVIAVVAWLALGAAAPFAETAQSKKGTDLAIVVHPGRRGPG